MNHILGRLFPNYNLKVDFVASSAPSRKRKIDLNWPIEQRVGFHFLKNKLKTHILGVFGVKKVLKNNHFEGGNLNELGKL